MSFAFDGLLFAGVTFTGPVRGEAMLERDALLRPSRQTVLGGSPIDYAYDADDLLVQVGALSLGREASSGRLASTTLGATASAYAYAPHGEVSALAYTQAGAPQLGFAYAHDALGRIQQITEASDEGVHVTDYGYDPLGRLESVRVDGAETERSSAPQKCGPRIGERDGASSGPGRGRNAGAFRPSDWRAAGPVPPTNRREHL